jgi:sulfur-carrier protein adenylyltransferase/sulfurtransferase
MAIPYDASPQDAHVAIQAGQAVLVDVREPWEYEQKHIPGSLLIPLAELPQRLDELPGDQDIYVHCRVGGRSSRAVEFLREAGRPRSVNVTGGIEAWEDAGLPVA